MTYQLIVDAETHREYEVQIKNFNGENIQRCPACSDDRKAKNKNKKPFSYNAGLGVGKCQNCGHKFYKKTNDVKQDYKRPTWENKTNLSDKVLEWFQQRNIITHAGN
jgi:twinkle protein